MSTRCLLTRFSYTLSSGYIPSANRATAGLDCAEAGHLAAAKARRRLVRSARSERGIR